MGKEKHKKKDKTRDVDVDDESTKEKEHKKTRKKSEKIAKMFGYSNDTNPFGDSNLLQPFVWGKKVEKDRSLGKKVEDTEESRFKIIQDIEKVRKRRADRERELEEMQKLRDDELRLRELAQYGDWEEKEEDFHMQQTKVRSKLRLIENREKPIDRLAKNILLLESVSSTNEEELSLAFSLAQLEEDVTDPLSLLNGLDDDALTDLLRDIEGYYEIEKKKSGGYLAFWEALLHVVNAEKKARSRKETTLHKSVYSEVQRMFANKTSSELLELRDDIRKSIREGRRSDVEYWELMEKEVDIERSRAIIREIYQDLLTKQIEALTKLREVALKRSSDEENNEENNEGGGDSGRSGSRKRPREGVDYRFVRNITDKGTLKSTNHQDEELLDHHPPLIGQLPSTNSSQLINRSIRFEEDVEDLDPETEEFMHPRDEISLPGTTYWWQDKFRPRKPRYSNNVKTGYDWNKYNSTHYDKDNPPPKIIQGYKFNIFYPDLIDVMDTPKYFLEGTDEREFAIIRFHAGPPYEDIAFKIVNQQWDTGFKSGFKCTFERGVLKLHFNFRRHRYRS